MWIAEFCEYMSVVQACLKLLIARIVKILSRIANPLLDCRNASRYFVYARRITLKWIHLGEMNFGFSRFNEFCLERIQASYGSFERKSSLPTNIVPFLIIHFEYKRVCNAGLEMQAECNQAIFHWTPIVPLALFLSASRLKQCNRYPLELKNPAIEHPNGSN